MVDHLSNVHLASIVRRGPDLERGVTDLTELAELGAAGHRETRRTGGRRGSLWPG
jgi:hypothetical protein